MYLSRIQLTDAIAGHSQLGQMLKDRSYGMHRLLWDLFPEKQRFLFREERASEQRQGSGNQPLYYLLSDSKPVQDSPLFQIDSKPFVPQLEVGEQLAFRLRANPVVTRKQEGKARSSRHDVVMDAQRHWLLDACKTRDLSIDGPKRALKQRLSQHVDFQEAAGIQRMNAALEQAIIAASTEWLERRGFRHGFAVETVNFEATGYRWHALPEKGRHAGFASIDYEGVLEVRDPEAFLAMLCKGLGPAKGFGCGLMLIRRL